MYWYSGHTKAGKTALLLKVWILLSALFSFYCAGNPSQAQNHSVVNLATGEGYFPYIDRKLMSGGWSQALVEQTFLLMGLDINVEVLPWSRGLKWTQDAKFLGTFPYVYSAERAEHFLFSVPINTVPIHMYVAANSAYKNIEQMQGKRLCIPHGYTIGQAEQLIVTQYAMSINRAKDAIGCIGQVRRGWSDAGLTNGYVAPDKLSDVDHGVAPIVIFEQQLSSEPLYFLIGKNYPDAQRWMDKFNQAFSQLQATGQKHKIDQMFIEAITPP